MQQTKIKYEVQFFNIYFNGPRLVIKKSKFHRKIILLKTQNYLSHAVNIIRSYKTELNIKRLFIHKLPERLRQVINYAGIDSTVHL